MNRLRIALLAFLCSSAPAADLDRIIPSARSAKGEFSAEALIRLASVPQLPAPSKIELLEMAFDRAAAAQQAYKRRPALRLMGAAAHLNKVFAQDMDGLSLRLRAVETLLPLDAVKARALFLKIPEIRLPRVKCDDFLVYDVARFYDVLGLLARQSTPADAAALLNRYAAIASPVQAGPMARVIASYAASDSDFAALVAAFAKALAKVEGDDRSFTDSRTLGKDIEALAAEARRRKISPLPLLESYRVYLVIHLSSARCADNDLVPGGQPDFVAFFNGSLRTEPLRPIDELESTPSQMTGVATGLRSCEGEACRAAAGQLRALLLAPGGQPYTPAEKMSPEWASRFRKTVQDAAAWKPEPGEAAVQYFREKAAIFSELAGLAPDGPTRQFIFRAALEFLAKNPIQSSHPLEWFLPVNALIGRTALDPNTFAWVRLEQIMLKSPDPVIALFAGIEEVAPRSPDRILPLL